MCTVNCPVPYIRYSTSKDPPGCVSHQYYENPCYCGRTHFQQYTVSAGVVPTKEQAERDPHQDPFNSDQVYACLRPDLYCVHTADHPYESSAGTTRLEEDPTASVAHTIAEQTSSPTKISNRISLDNINEKQQPNANSFMLKDAQTSATDSMGHSIYKKDCRDVKMATTSKGMSSDGVNEKQQQNSIILKDAQISATDCMGHCIYKKDCRDVKMATTSKGMSSDGFYEKQQQNPLILKDAQISAPDCMGHCIYKKDCRDVKMATTTNGMSSHGVIEKQQQNSFILKDAQISTMDFPNQRPTDRKCHCIYKKASRDVKNQQVQCETNTTATRKNQKNATVSTSSKTHVKCKSRITRQTNDIKVMAAATDTEDEDYEACDSREEELRTSSIPLKEMESDKATAIKTPCHICTQTSTMQDSGFCFPCTIPYIPCITPNNAIYGIIDIECMKQLLRQIRTAQSEDQTSHQTVQSNNPQGRELSRDRRQKTGQDKEKPKLQTEYEKEKLRKKQEKYKDEKCGVKDCDCDKKKKFCWGKKKCTCPKN